MYVCIRRGSDQIGGSCVEIACGSKRLLIDLGLPLDSELSDGNLLPPVQGLQNSGKSLLGIVISHLHLDHFGLLSQISKKIPIIMGVAARQICLKAASFMNDDWPTPAIGMDLISEIPIEIGPFVITPFLIDHSAYDAYAILVDGDGKRLFYSGDFRMHGRKAKLTKKLTENPPKSIDVLLLEGTQIGASVTNSRAFSESDVEKKLTQVFAEAKGSVLVHASSQNIDRIVSTFRAAKKTGRRLIMDLYTAVVLEATGNPNIPQSHWPEISLYVPQAQRVMIKNKRLFAQLTAHSANRVFPEHLRGIAPESVFLFRPHLMNDLERNDCLNNAVYVYSMWEGYWETNSFTKVKEWLRRHNIERIPIHTSGHASPIDLQGFAKALMPKRIVPIHTVNPNRYGDFLDNVELHSDGEWWEL